VRERASFELTDFGQQLRVIIRCAADNREVILVESGDRIAASGEMGSGPAARHVGELPVSVRGYAKARVKLVGYSEGVRDRR
jgi:hypothetical protein